MRERAALGRAAGAGSCFDFPSQCGCSQILVGWRCPFPQAAEVRTLLRVWTSSEDGNSEIGSAPLEPGKRDAPARRVLTYVLD